MESFSASASGVSSLVVSFFLLPFITLIKEDGNVVLNELLFCLLKDNPNCCSFNQQHLRKFSIDRVIAF